MRNVWRNLWMTCVVAAAAACGGGDDGEEFLGTYSVTSHRWNLGQGATISCDDAGAEVTDGDPYVALVVDPFFADALFIRLQSCAAPGDCVDELVTFSAGGPGLEDEGFNTQTSGGATACGLYAQRHTATLTGDLLRVELRYWSEFNDLPESQCTLDRAEALIGSPQCREVEIWDAVRVAAQ